MPTTLYACAVGGEKLPAYLSLKKYEDNSITIAVRNHGSATPAEIELSRKQLGDLAGTIREYLADGYSHLGTLLFSRDKPYGSPD